MNKKDFSLIDNKNNNGEKTKLLFISRRAVNFTLKFA